MSSVMGALTENRRRYSDELLGDERYHWLSATALALVDGLSEILTRYVRGRTLDAGAGQLNARHLLKPHCAEYVSLDYTQTCAELDLVADMHDLAIIPSASFDCVFSSQVFEHLKRPEVAIAEIARILRPGGSLIVSVPFLAGLHEEPYDFYRYTPYGLRQLFEHAGFKVVEEKRQGGMLSFLSHPISWLLVISCWRVPGLRWAMWGLNALLIVMPVRALDRALGTARKYPQNLLFVGIKTSGEAAPTSR